MKIEDWFDPHNENHIEAYQYLCQTGTWPEGFIPEDVQCDHNWQILLWHKMADAWVGHMVSLDIG